MRFTVVFSGEEAIDRSYGLVFVPSPVWVRGDKELVNLNPENPYYQLGSVKKLFRHERLEESLWPKRCTLIAHPEGHGRFEDLHALVKDLEAESVAVTVLVNR